ncbi:MAG: endonuclease III [Firmicutes bacterium]|nr:endonuclease III [Bacillota bacterium]
MAKLKKAEIQPLVDKLLELYPNAECALHFGTVYQLIVAVALSAQTTDKSVNEVTPALFERCPDAHAMAQIAEEELQSLIKRIGMYKTKSKNIIKMAQMLVEKYDGEVPEDYDKLVELPGVGRKTANVVLSVGFGHQRIAVDTHVFRLANRMGFVKETDVLKTELGLMKAVPEQYWSALHHALIWHGRQVCDARKPQCETCGVCELCKKNLTPAKAGKQESKPATRKKPAAKSE